MALHPAISAVVDQFTRQELHAARSGREVMRALAQVVSDSSAADSATLAREIEVAVDALLGVLPAYAPPLNVMHQVMVVVEQARGLPLEAFRRRMAELAQAFQEWSEQARSNLVAYGARLIQTGATVFTHTLSETIVATLAEARRQRKDFRLLVTESRPNDDGLVTAARAYDLGIAVAVSVDACLGALVRRANLVLVGAEAVLADGSAVCKVGTYPAALVAQTIRCPVYVVVDTLKFNASSLLGLPLWLDPLPAVDVVPAGWSGYARIVGHLFDTTPARLIRGVVTERGVLSPSACAAFMHSMPLSTTLAGKLAVWLQRKQSYLVQP